MAENAKKTAQAGTEGENGTVKTFTQDEVNAIVGKRIQEEKSKYADYNELKEKAGKYDESVEANKSEIQKATERAAALQAELNGYKKQEELRKVREKVAKETGVPVELLSGEDEETCKNQAEAMNAWKGTKQKYPATERNNGHSRSQISEDEAYRDAARRIFGRKE